MNDDVKASHREAELALALRLSIVLGIAAGAAFFAVGGWLLATIALVLGFLLSAYLSNRDGGDPTNA